MVSLGALATKIFGSSNDRRLKSFNARVAPINALEPKFEALSDDELRGKTNGVPRAAGQWARPSTIFCPKPSPRCARRPSARSVSGTSMCSSLAAWFCTRGRISEMKTGEGKTLVSTLPAYLNALPGRGVHIVTVNDYLAKRDSEWMGQIYKFLGLTVGCILHDLDDDQRRARLWLRHHLRNEQRVRLRLSARQYEIRHRGDGAVRRPSRGAAGAQLCDRRRGELDPDRRGAHSAHHLGRHRGQVRPLQHHRQVHPQARQGAFRARREDAHGCLQRGGQSAHGGDAGGGGLSEARRPRSTMSRT